MKINEKTLARFAARLQAEERSPATVEKYCREAARFAAWLDGRSVDRSLALAYKAELMERRAPAGVNGAVVALNRLLDILGAPGCRLKAVKVQRQIFRDEEKELTEKEYRRLLTAARRKRSERLLLVMESICATGIRVSELQFFTVEAVRLGRAEVVNKGKCRTVFLPGKLQKALLRYAKAHKIATGPVFVTRNGRPMDRSNIWHEMKALCREAGVAESKVFPPQPAAPVRPDVLWAGEGYRQISGYPGTQQHQHDPYLHHGVGYHAQAAAGENAAGDIKENHGIVVPW